MSGRRIKVIALKIFDALFITVVSEIFGLLFELVADALGHGEPLVLHSVDEIVEVIPTDRERPLEIAHKFHVLVERLGQRGVKQIAENDTLVEGGIELEIDLLDGFIVPKNLIDRGVDWNVERRRQ